MEKMDQYVVRINETVNLDAFWRDMNATILFGKSGQERFITITTTQEKANLLKSMDGVISIFKPSKLKPAQV